MMSENDEKKPSKKPAELPLRLVIEASGNPHLMTSNREHMKNITDLIKKQQKEILDLHSSFNKKRNASNTKQTVIETCKKKLKMSYERDDVAASVPPQVIVTKKIKWKKQEMLSCP